MRHCAWFVLAVCLLADAPARGDDKEKADGEKLVGVWTATAATRDGKPLPEAIVKQLRLTITKEGGWKTERGKQVLFDTTFKTDATKKPKHIDLLGTEGENKGKVAPGIYTIDGDTFTICYVMPGKDRPKELESKVGSEATLVVWKRAKQ